MVIVIYVYKRGKKIFSKLLLAQGCLYEQACLYSNYDVSYIAACIFVCERLRMYRPMIDIHKIWW